MRGYGEQIGGYCIWLFYFIVLFVFAIHDKTVRHRGTKGFDANEAVMR